MAHCHAKEILSAVPKRDLLLCLEEVNIGSDLLPHSGTLGLLGAFCLHSLVLREGAVDTIYFDNALTC